MKTERKIFIAFGLNLFFAVLEFVGGIITGSVAIAADALHDFVDAASIGISFLLERKSRQKPDDAYTYGYGRFSALGSLLTTGFLILGSVLIVGNAVLRIFRPVPIDYNGMLLFAVVGVCVNLGAAFVTREGDSLNQKAVNLHMLEDVLGWLAVLVGAVVMRLADLPIVDPILSVLVSGFILVSAVGNLRQTLGVFLEKVPENLHLNEIRAALEEIDGVISLHHLHIWSLDGQNHCATVHLVTDGEAHRMKETARRVFEAFGIDHVTLELESSQEHCHHPVCVARHSCHHAHHH